MSSSYNEPLSFPTPVSLGGGALFPDDVFTVYDNLDNSKKFMLLCDNVSTSTTRVATVPDMEMLFPGYDINNNLLLGPLTNSIVAGTNNVLFGAATGSDINAGSNNIIIGHNSLAGDPSAINRIILGNSTSGVSDNTLHVSPNITGFHFPNLPILGAPGTNTLYFDSLTGLIEAGPVPGSSATTGYDNSAALIDRFSITNFTDPTKKLEFNAANITTGTTRVCTIPDGSSTLPFTFPGGFSVGTSSFPALAGGVRNSIVSPSGASSLTSGNDNTLLGYISTPNLTTGSRNTIIGSQILGSNPGQSLTTGDDNIYIGSAIGTANVSGSGNIGIGSGSGSAGPFVNAALSDSVCIGNYAGPFIGFDGAICIGASTITNSSGDGCTVIGHYAGANARPVNTTLVGYNALINSTDVGSTDIVALGSYAIGSGSIGGGPIVRTVAIGHRASFASTNSTQNTIVGDRAGQTHVNTGSNNVLLGSTAELSASGDSNCIIIGSGVTGTATSQTRIGSTQTSCFIAGISGAAVGVSSGVLVNAAGRLGTIVSSAKYKENIQDMDLADAMYLLRPVSFNYKTDDSKLTNYGLIAEEVEHVFPELVVRDANGEIQSVQYHVLPAMLLHVVQEQKKEIDLLRSRIDLLESIL